MKCRKLRELSLKGMRFDTEQSANNFWELVRVSPSLESLKVTGCVLSAVTPKATSIPLAMLGLLDLSRNDLCKEQAADFVGLILANSKPRLRYLNLSGNPRIGDNGCLIVIGMLWTRNHWLEGIKLEGTGIRDPRTKQSVNSYLSHHNRIHSAL
ncbi:hypothetical protein B0O80DRAFT_440416 [Mortierella sp. GBAus27b]|nr:hypothetical protein B0O80DRAFT_440416 [Mortierella sp. GBAus27b]